MTKAASKTGLGPAISVAVERYYPKDQRILDDDLAYRILPLAVRAFLSPMRSRPVRERIVRVLEKRAPGIWGGVLCRKRYIDEKLIEQASVGQGVIMVRVAASLYAIPFYTALGYRRTTGVRSGRSFEGTGLRYQPMKKALVR